MASRTFPLKWRSHELQFPTNCARAPRITVKYEIPLLLRRPPFQSWFYPTYLGGGSGDGTKRNTEDNHSHGTECAVQCWGWNSSISHRIVASSSQHCCDWPTDLAISDGWKPRARGSCRKSLMIYIPDSIRNCGMIPAGLWLWWCRQSRV